MAVDSIKTWLYQCVHNQNMVLLMFKLLLVIFEFNSVMGQLTENQVLAQENDDVPFLMSVAASEKINKTEVVDPCEAFFDAYTKAVGNLTRCELSNAKPFRLCSRCIPQYAVAKAIYTDLITLPKLADCKDKYLRGDRVQIIPTLQQNIEDLWGNADCDGCSSDIHLSHNTSEVNYTIPDEVSKFILLYKNLSRCLNISFTSFADTEDVWMHNGSVGNSSIMCDKCKERYTVLNQHYDKVWDAKGGKVCMDMVDMMNYTRQMWSSHLNCVHRSGDAVPVIVITLVVACTPAFFYISLRITGKERRKKIYKQKRLTSSNQESVSAGSVDIGRTAAAGDSNSTPRTLTAFS